MGVLGTLAACLVPVPFHHQKEKWMNKSFAASMMAGPDRNVFYGPVILQVFSTLQKNNATI